MARPGPASKAVKHGRTPNAEWTEVPDTPYLGPSPELPRLAGRRKWQDIVVQWWEQVRVMPHCRLWGPTDWQFAVETAMLKDAFWRDYHDGAMKTTAATEIRRREDQMGTTAEARRKVQIRYVPVGDEVLLPEPDMPVEVVEQPVAATGTATVTPIADRRARLTRPA